VAVLKYIEAMLQQHMPVEADGSSPPKQGDQTWQSGTHFFAMHGQTPAKVRQDLVDKFNEKGATGIHAFLMTTLSSGIGINLTAANRVVLFDSNWNPSHDEQAVCRTYRYGQTKPVFVYRLVAQGTVEQKVYKRAVVKTGLSKRIVDDTEVERHYNTKVPTIDTLKYDGAASDADSDDESMPSYLPPRDPLLASLMAAQQLWPDYIQGFHEHDALFEEQQELTKEEIEAAWKKYNSNENGQEQEGPKLLDLLQVLKNPTYEKMVVSALETDPKLQARITGIRNKWQHGTNPESEQAKVEMDVLLRQILSGSLHSGESSQDMPATISDLGLAEPSTTL